MSRFLVSIYLDQINSKLLEKKIISALTLHNVLYSTNFVQTAYLFLVTTKVRKNCNIFKKINWRKIL